MVLATEQFYPTPLHCTMHYKIFVQKRKVL